jgi:hypothetical protein
MEEVFPVLAGIVVGLAIHPIASKLVRVILLVAASVLFGALASWISGELVVSAIYVPIDAAQVFGAGAATAVLVARLRRRSLARARF